MEKLGIVVPVWIQNFHLLNLTYQAAESWYCSHPCQVYVVTNRLHTITPVDFQKELSKRSKLPVCVLHEDGVERSVAGAWNHGTRTAWYNGCDRFLITANDVIWEQPAIDRLIAFGDRKDTANVLLWSGINTKDKTEIDETQEVDACDFSGTMFKSDFLERVGWFDEGFKPGYYEDGDAVARCYLSGGECRAIHAAKFYHHGSMTVKMDGEASHHVSHWFPRNRKRFVEKWGCAPVNTREEALRLYFKHPWNDASKSISFCER